MIRDMSENEQVPVALSGQDEEPDEATDEVVLENVLWIVEEGGVKFAVGQQLFDEVVKDGQLVKEGSGIVIEAIDELLGEAGGGGDFKLYAKPLPEGYVHPTDPSIRATPMSAELHKRNMGLVMYIPRRRIEKWASVGPLDAMMKAREEAMQVEGEEPEEPEEEANVEEEPAGQDGTPVDNSHGEGSGDLGASPGKIGGTLPLGGGGTLDPGAGATSSGG